MQVWESRALICGMFLLSAPTRSYLPFATKINVLIDIRAYYNEFPLHFDTAPPKNVIPRVPSFFQQFTALSLLSLLVSPGFFFFFLATRGWIGNDMKTKLIDCNSIFQFLFISMFIVVHETSIWRVTRHPFSLLLFLFNSFYTGIVFSIFLFLDWAVHADQGVYLLVLDELLKSFNLRRKT